MKYIKENSVFVILLTLMVLMLIYLGSLFLVSENQRFASDSANSSTAATTDISSFNVSLNENQLDYNWNLVTGAKSIKKVELYHDDTLIADVTSRATYSQNLLSSGFDTGNNQFSIVVSLDDDTTLKKSIYYYINEAFNFTVSDSENNGTVTYVATYYYEKARPLSSPKVKVALSGGASAQIKYVNTSNENVNDKFVKASAKYSMNVKNIKKGNYQAEMTWTFDEYNLTYNTESSFDASGEK